MNTEKYRKQLIKAAVSNISINPSLTPTAVATRAIKIADAVIDKIQRDIP